MPVKDKLLQDALIFRDINIVHKGASELYLQPPDHLFRAELASHFLDGYVYSKYFRRQ